MSWTVSVAFAIPRRIASSKLSLDSAVISITFAIEVVTLFGSISVAIAASSTARAPARGRCRSPRRAAPPRRRRSARTTTAATCWSTSRRGGSDGNTDRAEEGDDLDREGDRDHRRVERELRGRDPARDREGDGDRPRHPGRLGREPAGQGRGRQGRRLPGRPEGHVLSLIHISEPTRRTPI